MKTYTTFFESEPLYVHIIDESAGGALTALVSWAGVEEHVVFRDEAAVEAFLANESRVARFIEQMCHNSF